MVEQVLADVRVWVVQLVLPPWSIHRRDDLARLWKHKYKNDDLSTEGGRRLFSVNTLASFEWKKSGFAHNTAGSLHMCLAKKQCCS